MSMANVKNSENSIHPMMLVNHENYLDRMEECVEHLGQFLQEHPNYARSFKGIYDGLCALQTAVQDESLSDFETLLVQQTYGYHFYSMAIKSGDSKVIEQELLYTLAGIEHVTFQLLSSCTGIFRVLMDGETPGLEKLICLLGHFQKAMGECKPNEARRLRRALSSKVARLICATEAMVAIAERASVSEVDGAVSDWQRAADDYDAAFVKGFHKRYIPFGCVKGHHLIHEVDKGIAFLIKRVKGTLNNELEVSEE